ncbi:S8 family peptidase [Bdellovibrio sp. HCB2-146]|uniref:S8 family peptidase n=1 Tax=Bdellovibrio sp. HCB2-146 TaxID=3394362 RepID=UPI0039BD2787
MDVQKILSAVAIIFALSACSYKKSAESVFPGKSGADAAACLGQAIQTRFIVEWEDGKFTVEKSSSADKFEKEFIVPKLNEIRFVQYDRTFQVETAKEVRASGYSDSWGQQMIKADTLWAQGIYGQNIKVGVVDSYVDTSHPQIRPRIAVNAAEIPGNGIDDDGNGVVDDYYGARFVSTPGTNPTTSSHGTHVTGIIAADPNYGDIQGVAPQSQIIPAQFISDDGRGTLGDAILAMQYAVSRGARIINASWGGSPCDTSLKNAFVSLQDRGILVVVAAGNEGTDIDVSPTFPAAFNVGTQITVAASSRMDFMTYWSNSGFNLVHVAAPGEDILSTVPNNGTAYMDGTSMAAPMVSGAAALLMSARPTATAVQVKQAILQSVDVTSGHQFKVNTRGRINVQKALEVLTRLVP